MLERAFAEKNRRTQGEKRRGRRKAPESWCGGQAFILDNIKDQLS